MAAGSAFASGEKKESKATMVIARKIVVRYFFKEFSLLLSAIIFNVSSGFKISGIIFYLGFP
jgi:hypothetical protein